MSQATDLLGADPARPTTASPSASASLAAAMTPSSSTSASPAPSTPAPTAAPAPPPPPPPGAAPAPALLSHPAQAVATAASTASPISSSAAVPTSVTSLPTTAATTTTSTATSLAAPPVPSAAAASASFKFPHYYNFPPMFTLQPNLATRRAQMDKWSALVLAYCRHYRIFRLAWGETPTAGGSTTPSGPVRIDGNGVTPGVNIDDDADDDANHGSVTYYAPDLFHNRQIDRSLAPAAIREVLEALKKEGRAEFGDSSSSSAAFIYWKKPEEWAAVVEAFVDDTAQRGSVLTLYELTAGDGTRGTELFGLDPAVLQKALAVLVKRGKAQVFGQAESLGVKFF